MNSHADEYQMRFQDALMRMHLNEYLLRNRMDLRSYDGRMAKPGQIRRSLYGNFLSSAYACRDTVRECLQKAGYQEFCIELMREIDEDELLSYVIISRIAEDHRADGSRLAPLISKRKVDIVTRRSLVFTLTGPHWQETGYTVDAFERATTKLRRFKISDKREKRGGDKLIQLPIQHRGRPIPGKLTLERVAYYCLQWWIEVWMNFSAGDLRLPEQGIPGVDIEPLIGANLFAL